tara:strand:+ start:12 stop:1352 length:1341 start_codon:yes stop_codon:yes gene_type:complete
MKIVNLFSLITFILMQFCLVAQNDKSEIRAYTNDLLSKLNIEPLDGEYKEYFVEDNGKMLTIAVNTTKGNYCFHKYEEYLIVDRSCPYTALLKNAKRQFEFYCLEPGKFFVLEPGKKQKGCALAKDFKDEIFKDFLLEPDLTKKNVNKEDIFDINTKKKFKPNTIIEVSNYSDGLAAFKKNKWGYVDRLGNIVVEAKYQYARPFSEQLAAVQLDNDLWGYLNTEGKMAHFAQYNHALSYSSGLAAVENNKEKFGYINKDGRRVINFQFDDAKSFSEGLAPVRIGKLWGYIDTTGKIVIEPQFEFAEPFKDGLAIASPDWLFGFINREGEYFIKAHYLEVREFSDGKAAVMPDPSRTKHLNGKKRWGYIDKRGNKIIEYKFEDALSFTQGLAGVSVDQRWGFIDVNGNFNISPKFDYVAPFKNNAALVIYNSQWRYISLDGEFLFEE